METMSSQTPFDTAPLRIGFTVVAIGIVSVNIWIFFGSFEAAKFLKDVQYSDLIGKALDVKLAQSQRGADLTLIACASLCALLIAKKDEIRIYLNDVPEIIMLFCASFLLLFSFYLYITYVNKISYIMSLAGGMFNEKKGSLPDVFNSSLNTPLTMQFIFLYSGIFVTGLTLFSAYRLKTS
jgi:hypothetical protein